MDKPKQSMSGVTGKNVSQQSDEKGTDQEMQNINAAGEVEQKIKSQRDDNSLSLSGFGKAKGKWAVVGIAILFALFLAWKLLMAR